MSEIAKARSKLSSVGTLLKKGKYLPALLAIQQSLEIYLKTPLLKHEKVDFQKKIEDALYLLKINKEFVQQYPIPIDYTPGEEKSLWKKLKDAAKELKDSAVDEARKQMEALEQLKARELELGRGQLKDKKYDLAEKTFRRLINTFKEDTDLKLTITDMYMEQGLIDQALKYMEDAYNDDPSAIYVLNKMGIVLRKAGKLDLAEKIFKEAISKSPDDEYLYFNLGRVYIDEKRWNDVIDIAKKAIEINPSFKEADKMLKYAEKAIR